MADRRAAGLRRVVRVPELAGTVYGGVASAVFVTLGVTASAAAGLTPLAFVVAALVFVLTLMSYLEGVTAVPHAGGSSHFARRAFNDLVSFIAGWALILDYLIIIAISAFFATSYAAGIPGLGVLSESPWNSIFGVSLIVLAVGANVAGVHVGARVTLSIAFVAIGLQAGLIIAGLLIGFDGTALTDSVTAGVDPLDFLYAIPIALIGFAGVELVANLMEELRQPARDAPRPLLSAAAMGVVLSVGMTLVGLMVLPVHRGPDGKPQTLLGVLGGDGYQDRPVLGVVENIGFPSGLEHALTIATSLVALGVMYFAARSGILGVSRLAYALARNRQLPRALARIDRHRGTPNIAIVLFASVSCGLLVLTNAYARSPIFLAHLYAFGAMLGFMIAHMSIVALRFHEPDLPRPYRAPFNIRVRSVSVPLSSLIGCVVCAAIWTITVATHDSARTVGFLWMIAGLAGYGTFRLLQGMTLTEARVLETTSPVQEVEFSTYDRILLAMRPADDMSAAPADAEVAALAQKLLDQTEASRIDVMVVHELPLTQPLNADLGPAEQVTAQRIGRVRALVQKHGIGMQSTVTRARAAGRIICQEASRRNCQLVVMSAPPKRRVDDSVFGKTVDYVLRHAPCDVAVLKLPRPGRME